jgi:hypothetical protein
MEDGELRRVFMPGCTWFPIEITKGWELAVNG